MVTYSNFSKPLNQLAKFIVLFFFVKLIKGKIVHSLPIYQMLTVKSKAPLLLSRGYTIAVSMMNSDIS